MHSDDALDLSSYEKCLEADADGQIWIGTSGSGLYQMDPKTERFRHYGVKEGSSDGLSHSIVTDISTSKDGSIWISTDGGGLNRLDKEKDEFQHFLAETGYSRALNTNALYNLLLDDVGNLWVGTFNGGVNVWKNISTPYLVDVHQLDHKMLGLRSVLALESDPDGRVWIGCDGGGLFFIDPPVSRRKIQAAVVRGKPFPKSVITCLKSTSKDILWIGT